MILRGPSIEFIHKTIALYTFDPGMSYMTDVEHPNGIGYLILRGINNLIGVCAMTQQKRDTARQGSGAY